MAHCLITTSKEYQNLATSVIENNLDIAKLYKNITTWQNENKSYDDYPSFEELKEIYDRIPIKPGVPELFESNPELAQSVYEALGFNQLITSNDKIVWGHPTIGKTTMLESNPNAFIDWDNEFNRKRDNWIANKSNTVVGTPEFKKARNEYMINYNNHKDYIAFVTEEWNKAKEKANKESKILIASPHMLLNLFPNDFDKIITMSDKTFMDRAVKRSNGDVVNSKLWKEGINETLKSVDKSKIIETDKYINDLFITPQQKQQALQVYSEYLDTIFPDSKVKDIVYHGTPFEFDSFKKPLDIKENIFNQHALAKEEDNPHAIYFQFEPKSFRKGRIVPAIINSKELIKKENYSGYSISYATGNRQKLEQQLGSKTFDALDITPIQGKRELLVFEPEQIHILGNKQDIEGFKKFVEDTPKDKIFKQKSEQGVDFQLKAVNILLSDKAKQVFAKGEKNNWSLEKILTELAIPKEQKQLVLDLGKTNREEIITGLLANYSYTIEINTTKVFENIESIEEVEPGLWSFRGNDFYSYSDAVDAKNEYNESRKEESTQQYKNLSARDKNNNVKYENNPDWTYKEIQINTPLIEPSIKGHTAPFDNANGIGWIRVWTNEKTGEVEIQEIQSDLFQKGRDRKDLVNLNDAGRELQEEDSYTITRRNGNVIYIAQSTANYYAVKTFEGDGYRTEIIPFRNFPQDVQDEINQLREDKKKEANKNTGLETRKENQFLQLLNKDSNWVTFFIKATIQNFAKQGYTTIRFPKGETAAKIEGHTTIADEIRKIDDKIVKLKQRISDNKKDIVVEGRLNSALSKLKEAKDTLKWQEQNDAPTWAIERSKDNINNLQYTIDKYAQNNTQSIMLKNLEEEKANLKSQGIEKLKPIEAFYEIKVGNILEKQFGKENVKTITDEFSNQWREIKIKDSYTDTILLQKTPLYLNLEQEAIKEKDKLTLNPTQVIEKLKLSFAKAGINVEVVENNSLEEKGIAVITAEGKTRVEYNVNNMSDDTLPHEFGHIYIELLGEDHPLIKEGIDKLLGTDLYLEVQAAYPELSGMGLQKEVLATAIGLEGAEIFKSQEELSKFRIWLNKLWYKISQLLGINDSNKARVLAKDMLYNNIRPELTPLQKEIVYQQKANNNTKVKLDIKTDVLTKIVQELNRKIDILKHRDLTPLNKEFLEKRTETLNSLKELLNARTLLKDFSQDVLILKTYLEDANTSVLRFMNYIGVIEKSKDIAEERDNNINRIVHILNNMHEFDVVSKIVTLNEFKDDLELIKKEYPDTYTYLMNINSNLMILKDKLITNYAIPIYADYFIELAYDSKEAFEAAKKADLEELVLTRDKVIQELTQATKDISPLSMWVDPLISSKSEVLALFSKLVKKHLEESRATLIDIEFDLGEEYNKYVNQKGGAGLSNKTLYSDIIETIETLDNVNGERIWRKKQAFVQEYDVTKYQKAKHKALSGITDSKEYFKARDKWYTENTVPAPDNLKGIADEYKGKLVIPNGKYKNAKYEKIKGNPFYKAMVQKYLDSQEIVPPAHRLGYVLPYVQKTTMDTFIEQGIIAGAKEIGKSSIIKRPTDYETGLQGISGEEAKFIPVRFTSYTEIENVSNDAFSSVLLYMQSAYDYDAKNKLHGHANLLLNIIKNRDVAVTDSKGNPVKDAYSGKFGRADYVNKGSSRTNEERALEEFIEKIFYDKSKVAVTTHSKLLNKDIDWNKVTDKMLMYTSMRALGFNFLQGTTNMMMGNIMTMVEGLGGQFYSISDWRKGNTYFRSNLHRLIGDVGKVGKKSIISQLIDIFDPVQGTFTDNYGKDVSGVKAKKLFSSDLIFIVQHSGELQIQSSTLFALMSKYKVKDKNGKEIMGTNGKPLSLLEAYQNTDKNGKIKLDDRVVFTAKEKELFINRLHGINKNLHGVYNSFDKGIAHRYIVGRLLLQFRNFVIPGWRRRMGNAYIDYEINDVMEGSYRTFAKFYFKKVLNLIKKTDTRSFKDLGQFEKSNIRKTWAEIMVVALLFLVYGANNDDDDDKWYNHMLAYTARRVASEMMFFVSPPDAWRILKSPAASTSTMEAFIKLTIQLADPTEVYERASGIHKKGDNKALARFSTMLPMLNGIEKSSSPEEGIKFFENYWFTMQ